MGSAVLNTQLAHVSAAEMQHRIQMEPGMAVSVGTTAGAAGPPAAGPLATPLD